MFHALQLLCVLLVAVGMGLSLAHALEYPGKLRLDEEKYLVVQTIYYPGFTIGGMVGEFGAMLATLVLLFVTPYGSTAFTLTLIAFLLLAAAHAVFWLVNQPANKSGSPSSSSRVPARPSSRPAERSRPARTGGSPESAGNTATSFVRRFSSSASPC
jgi:hypothetical protein